MLTEQMERLRVNIRILAYEGRCSIPMDGHVKPNRAKNFRDSNALDFKQSRHLWFHKKIFQIQSKFELC